MEQQNLQGDMIRYIMTNMVDAVCVTDRHGFLLYYNPAAQALFGLPFKEEKGQRIWEYIPFVETNDNLIEMFIESIRSMQTSRHMLVQYENKQGMISHLRVSLRYTEENGGRFLVVISDLSELIKVKDAFTRYTSPQIADYVLYTPEGEARDGENREVTILMSDLRGFTAMSAAMEAKPLVQMLNHYFEKMVEVIDSSQGTVIEFLGDGIFVVFGAPKNDPDHAAHAVSCAIGMQNAMPEVNQWNQEHGFPELTMGIGISTGTCVVGNIGSDQKMKYGCVGESVNLAGRVESQTVGRQILITEATAVLMKEPLTTAGEFSFLPKGAKEPVTVYDVTALGTECRLEQTTKKLTWVRLEKPLTIEYFLLDENKGVYPDRLSGEIRSVSDDGSYLKLKAPSLPAFHQNVLIDIGGNLYGKVTGLEAEEAVICLTAFPDGYKDWFRNLR